MDGLPIILEDKSGTHALRARFTLQDREVYYTPEPGQAIT